MVTVNTKIATRTIEYPFRECYQLPVTTLGAILGSVAGVHGDIFPASIFSFVGEIPYELSPRYIGNGLSQTMIMHHAINRQVLNGDNTKFIDYLAGFLMRKVSTPVSDTLMDMSNNSLVFNPLWIILFTFRHFALGFSQCFFVNSEKTGVGYLIATRERGKGFQANINADSLFNFRQWRILNLARKGNKPFTDTISPDATSFNLTLNRSVNYGFNNTYFRQDYGFILNRIPNLRIGETVIPALATKSRITNLFAGFYTSKESLKRKVYPHRHVLQYLTMNIGKRWSVNFQHWQDSSLVIQTNRSRVFFPKIFALLKKVVIEPVTFTKSITHQMSLLFSRIDSILKGRLVHILYLNTMLADESSWLSSVA